MDIAERYVRLCLRIGRRVDGFVDAYVGPPEWEASIAAEEPADPARLREEAQALLGDLDGAELEGDRRRWLDAQLGALECITARLCGEEMGWADEVERCLGVRPARTATGDFADVHRRLDAVLPGSGAVRDRYVAWDARNTLPPATLIPALERLKDVLAPRAHALAALPEEESVTYALVSDEPWLAYNWYQGGFHSRVDVNAELPITIILLASLAAHEAYPGHHTERAAKDARLLRALGRVETCVAVAPTPESLVSEAIATNALEVALGPEAFDVVADVLSDLGVAFDPAEAHEVHRADMELDAVVTNVAFLLHEDGGTAEEAHAYLREWALAPDERAAHVTRFVTDPASRAYVSAYSDGRRLGAAFVEREANGFSRLLTEQLTTADLLA